MGELSRSGCGHFWLGVIAFARAQDLGHEIYSSSCEAMIEYCLRVGRHISQLDSQGVVYLLAESEGVATIPLTARPPHQQLSV